MAKNKLKIISVIRWVLASLLCVGIIVIAVFPFNNRSLRLQFATEEGKYEITKYSDEIANGQVQMLVFDQTEEIKIKELRIYGIIKSIYLEKVGYGQFINYISKVEDGELKQVEDGLLLIGNGSEGIQVVMNESFHELLKEHSESLLLERMILAELFGTLIALVWIILKAIEEKTIVDNRNNHSTIYEVKKFFSDVREYWQYTVYAARTDLKAEVADSYLNRLWWLLEPFFNMIVYVIVFGKVMGNSIQNYATFVFSALLMWKFFNNAINYSVKLVRNNKDIVTKVYIPKFIILISNMILNMFKLFFSLLVLVVMLIVFKVHIGINVLWVLPAYAVMILCAFGAGMIFLHFGVYVDDLSYAVGILLNLLMFLSGIFYEVKTTLPYPLNMIMMCLNPVAIFVDTMRNALLYNEASNLPLIGIWLLFSVLLCCVGVHTIYKNENSYVKVV